MKLKKTKRSPFVSQSHVIRPTLPPIGTSPFPLYTDQRIMVGFAAAIIEFTVPIYMPISTNFLRPRLVRDKVDPFIELFLWRMTRNCDFGKA